MNNAGAPLGTSTGSGLTAILPRLGASIVGLSFVGYLVGWICARSYFGAFGVSQFVSSLSPTVLLEQSSDFLWPALISMIFFMLNATFGSWSEDRVLVIRFWIAGISVIAYIVQAVMVWRLSDAWRPTELALAGIALVAWAIVLGCDIAVLDWRLRRSGGTWDRSHVSLVHTIVALGLWVAPTNWGMTRGRSDSDPRHSSLPTVVDSTANGGWRLLAVTGERAFLVKLREGGPPQVRLVPSADMLTLEMHE